MDNKAIAKRFMDEIWNKGNFQAADELLASDYVNHDPQVPAELKRGPEGFKTYARMQREGAPDLRCTIDQQLQDGDHVVTRWTMTGTNTARYMGMNPTNNRVNITGIAIQRFKNGKITESWGNWDTLGLLQQLGFVPKTQDMQQQHPGRAAQARRPEAK